ncbi:hypothetical protein [Luteolibacter sp. Populi]|uniref:lectin-like domain-containing protein n=1 Tax=Luteolibacter sp. Populi TaxID=3230487 RepID=UPI003467DB3D
MNPARTPILMATCLASAVACVPLDAAIVPVASAEASSNWNGLSLTKTIDGSGITGSLATEADLGIATHDNNGSAVTMWHSLIADGAGMTLTYAFTHASNLRTMYYWNHNQSGSNIDRGLQVAEVQYSTNGGADYQSLGNFNFTKATGGAAELPHPLDLGTTLNAVTHLRLVVVSDWGGIVTGLSEIRFSDIAPVEPKAIINLTASDLIVYDGSEITLSWSTQRVTSPVITPGIGAVAEADLAFVMVPPGKDTVYTLAGDSANGPVSASLTVRSVAGGPSTYKFVRFTPRKLRNDLTANSIQLAEFYLLNAGEKLEGATYTNPGGDNPAEQEPVYAGDGLNDTKWLDHNKGALQLEFPAAVTFDTYGFTTAGDAAERDPLRWIIEGSADGTTWTLIENITTFDYVTPTTRGTSTLDIPLPGNSLYPILKIEGDTKVVAGEPLSLRWTTEGATAVTLDSGSGPVALGSTNGGTTVTPAANTTYTFVATNAFGNTITAALSAAVVTPAVTTIDYDDFDDAGEEIALIGNAAVTADATLTVPGPGKRLRVTPNQSGMAGGAWFRLRQKVDEGFDTRFAVQFKATTTGGADGMAFVVQNHPIGSAAMPATLHEWGLAEAALNVSLDSYQNAGEPSNAVLRVLSGSAVEATVDLAMISGISFPGTLPGDLSDNTTTGAAHEVRVAYLPGNLDVYFDGVLVVDSLNIDLGVIEAMDGSGTSYAGFTARTGGASESHDVTSWSFSEGPPAPPLVILSSTINKLGGQASLTWASSPVKSYRITSSTDLVDWETVLESGIPGAVGADETVKTVSFPSAAGRLFIRVEEE